MAEGNIKVPNHKLGTITSIISQDQTTDLSWTAPDDGVLYLLIITKVRGYVGINLNGTPIAGSATYPLSATSPSSNTVTVIVNKGNVITVQNLNENCYLASASKFIPFL